MRRVVIVLALAAVVYAAFKLLAPGMENPVEATLSVAEALQSDTTGYRRAVYPATITFPDDHGAHPEFKTEWWYYTGNLKSQAGREFGYQFTIFRTALAPPGVVEAGSSWRAEQLYTAHFALSDPDTDRFYFSERSSRGAAGLAGGSARPFRIWLEDWSVRQDGRDAISSKLVASDEKYSVALRLVPQRPPILQGLDGFSPKDRDSSNASYYYSYTRIKTTGRLVVDADTFNVEGSTWMDHEWSTSALGPSQVGWDWFALRLSDGTDLMYFQVRERSGAPPFVEGTVRDEGGVVTRLSSENVRLGVTDRWVSPLSGISYPSGWQIVIPDLEVELDVEPVMKNQEMLLSVRYWEGAVSLSGTIGGAAVSGTGYVELTGYGDDSAEE